MDAVILAAGRNDRLRPNVPAYAKPLVLVDGVPIVKHQVIDLSDVCAGLVIVCSPQNVSMIHDVVEDVLGSFSWTSFVVQPVARGPIDALVRGSRCVRFADRVIMTCADNIIPRSVIHDVDRRLGHSEIIVTVKDIDVEDASRFTFFIGDRPREKEAIPAHVQGSLPCWIGPLVFTSKGLMDVLSENVPETFPELMMRFERRVFVVGDCNDIGVPEEVPS